jgi:hypothetical protein
MGQKSAVDKLPQALREKLITMLHEPAITQAEIVDAINAEAGEPLLSKSSMNRYAQRMKKFAEKNRQAREVADACLDRYGADTSDKLGKVVNEQTRLAVFDLMGEFEELKDDPEAKATDAADMLCKLSRGLRELEQAEKINAERTETIRKAAIAEAADVAATEAKSAGLSAELVDGLASRKDTPRNAKKRLCLTWRVLA